MNIIKKSVALSLVSVFALFCACSKEENKPLSKDKPYTFSKSVCTVYDGVTMNDLSSLIPSSALLPNFSAPKTVEEFEKMVVKYIDTYNIATRTENGQKRIYFKNYFEWIEISDTVCKFYDGEETVEKAYTQDGDRYIVETGVEEELILSYKNNALSYTIEGLDYFYVTHYFKLA